MWVCPFHRIAPIPARAPPSVASFLSRSDFLGDGFSMLNQSHGWIGVEDHRAAPLVRITFLIHINPHPGHRHTLLDHRFRLQIPEVAHQPVIGIAVGTPGGIHIDVVTHRIVEILVPLVKTAELFGFVRQADFVTDEPAEVPEQTGISLVVASSFNQELDALLDPLVSVAIVVKLGRHVVGQIVCLEFPHRNVIGLKLGDLVECGGQFIPALSSLVASRLGPEQIGRDAAQPERRHLHRLAEPDRSFPVQPGRVRNWRIRASVPPLEP